VKILQLLLPVIFIFSGLFLGLIFEKVILVKLKKLTVEVAKEILGNTPGGISYFEPFIRYHTFGEFSINFIVILRGKIFVDQYLIKHEFIKKLYNRYKQEGIEIPVYSKSFLVNN
jgi:small-conductance mechanosensitive channel